MGYLLVLVFNWVMMVSTVRSVLCSFTHPVDDDDDTLKMLALCAVTLKLTMRQTNGPTGYIGLSVNRLMGYRTNMLLLSLLSRQGP